MRKGSRNSIISRMNERFKSVLIAFVLVSAAFVGLIQTDITDFAEMASADSGGPDAFGYIWTNSTGTPSVPYTWVDGITGGTPLGLSDDDWAGPINMGMSFNYYGVIYTDIYIMSNGWVSFVGFDTWYQSSVLPGETFYQGVISPYSTDLDPSSSGEIYYKFIGGSPNQFVITWDAVPHFGSLDDQTFQVVLNDTGEIWFNYETMNNPDPFANVGIENEVSAIGLDYDSAGGTIYSGLSILFEYSPPPYRVVVNPENLEDYGFPATNVDYILTVSNMGANDDTYDLASALNFWPVTFRDIGDTMDITTIFVISNDKEDFIVRVSIPGPASPGEFDFANITVTSQGDPLESDYTNIRTSVPFNVNWQEGFESGWGGWRNEVLIPSSPTTDWEMGDPLGWGPSTAYNGTNCAGTNIADDFYWNADILFITPYVELGSGQQILSFYNWYEIDTMGNAGGFVEISANGGPWNQVFPRNGYPYIGGWIGGYFVDAYSGDSGGWFLDEFDLSAYSGQVVQVRFHFVADGWAFQAGWYLDDVYMGSPPPYRVEISPKWQEDYGYSASTVDYIFTVENTGVNDDTYDLSSSLHLWPIQFRDIGSGGQIFDIFVAAGTSEDFIARVNIPGAASPGDIDFANITATSQGDSSKDDVASIRTQVPYPVNWIEGFESGGGQWMTQVISESSFGSTYWEFGDPSAGPGPAYNGTNCAGTNIILDYYPDADICLISPYVELGSGYQILSFYQAYEIDTGGDDGAFVEISVEGGPWMQIWPEGGYPYPGGFVGGYNTDAYSGDSSGWTYGEFDLSTYSTQVVRARFHFAASPWWGWQWGWYLDDVYMGSPPPYRNALIPDWQADAGYPLENVDHILTVENMGANDDTYDLTSLNIWPLTFRNIGDTMDITSISLNSGSGVDFIARVTVPGFAVPSDFDIAMVNATSQNDSLVSSAAVIETHVPVPPPIFDDMESGPGPVWNWSDGDGTEWQWGNPSPWPWGPPISYSPFNCWGTNIVGNYTTDGEAFLAAPYFDLRIAMSANMTFWHWYDINPGWNDGGWVEISDDFGNSWNMLYPIGGYPEWTDMNIPCFAGTSFGWEQVEFDLAGYLGEVVRIRFQFWDDQFDGPVERAGWYIDDFNLSATYLAYGVELTPDSDFDIEPDGTNVLYRMTATNLGTVGPDTFDLSDMTILGWTVTFLDLTMTPITSVGPIGVGNSQDFYVQISIPGGTPPGTQETSIVTATSQNDPSPTPADDTSVIYTQVLALILLVDDDDGINSEVQFGTALTDAGWAYNLWDYDTHGAPELADLQQHKAVIWCTGNTYDDTLVPSLNLEDRTVLGNYLDSGGPLYLSSSLAGPDATNMFGGMEAWTSWYMTYLHSSFVNIGGFATPHGVNGTTGDPISHNLYLTAYEGDFNPSLWGAWGVNDPENFGIPFLTEPSSSFNIGMRADTGVYRMVQTSFDFATVNGAVNRSILMYRILKWLLDLPIVIDTVAQDGDIDVPINQNVQVIYSESMNTLITPTLNQVGGPDPGGWTFSGWSTTYVTDDTATWTHNNWAGSQDVNMSVSGAQDLDANIPDTYYWNFSTESTAAPWATATGPTSPLTNNPSPTITYNYGNAPTSVEIYWSDNGGASWNLWGTDASVDNSWPAGSPLPASGTYVWSARAMGVPNEPVPSGPGDVEASSYVLDIDAPSIFSTIPNDMATGVSTAAGIYVIEFDEPMDNVGTPLSDLPGLIWNWAPSGLWMNGSYNALNPSTTYYVDLAGQGFTDLAGNGLSGDMYKDFTTQTPDPWATATGPTSPLTNNPSPTITYNYGNGPTSVEIYWSDNGGISWNLWGTDASVDSSWPAGSPLPASGTYVWNARAIGVPNEPVPSGAGDVEASSYVLDIDAPSIFSTIPNDMATGISTVAGIYVIEFDEPMDNVGTPLSDLPGLIWNWAPSGLWINGSYNALNPSTTYYVDLAGQGFTDLAGNGLSGDMYKDFTTQAADPWATATGPTSPLTNNPSPTITYNYGNGPTSVEIYWSDNGGTSWNLWGTDASVDSSWPAGSPLPASGTYVWNARAIGTPNEAVPSGPGDIEASSYVLDIDAPSIFSTIPNDMATGISTAAGIYVIEFDEPMANIGTPLTDLPGVVWNWAPSGLWINGSYNVLNPGTTYYVDLAGQGFTDLVGNGLSGDMYKDFTTQVPDPWATATGPMLGPVNNPSPTITYNFGNAPTSVEIYWTDNGGASWNLWGTDASVDSSWPAGSPLPASGTYEWSVRAIGSVNESVPSGAGDIESGPYVLDIDAPSVFSTTPNDMATGISTAAGMYIIEFDEPMNTSFTPLSDLPGISWLWAPSGLWLNSSYNALNPGTTYYVDFTGQGFCDLADNALSGDLYKNFTTLISADPWATATGPTSSLTNNPSPSITYNYGNAPTSVEIYWSDNGGASWNLWGTDGSVDGSWPAAGPLPASGTYVWNARAIGAPSEAVPAGPGDVEVSSYILDIDAPSVFSTTPNDLATGISTVAGIYVIEFDEPMNTGFTPLSDLPGLVWNWAPSGLWLNGSYNALNPSTTYYVDFTGLGFVDLAGNALSGDLYKNFTTQIVANPWATATGPISLLTNNPSPTVTYSWGNAPTSVEIYWTDDGGSSWNLWGTDFSVDGSWPAGSPLPASGTYDWSARAIGAPSEAVPSGIGDFEAGSYVLDIDAPSVFSTIPLDTAIDVLLNQLIIIVFNEAMNPGSLTYTIEPNPGGLSESWIGGDTLQISHTDFAPGTRFWVNITGAADTAGNNLNPLPYSFYFDTEIPDNTPPTVSAWTPIGVAVLITANIVLTFSESMNTATVEAAFSFTDGVTTWTVADGTVNWNPTDDIMTFNPTANFDNSKIITVTVVATAEDANGNTLDGNANGTSEGSPTDDHVWQFTTESAPIPDTTPPTSVITVLPDHITDLTFNIVYTASDTESGVKEVELWYRKDGSGWGLYNTYIGGSRTVSFTANSDGEYDFYTRARDNDNNYESAPSIPDTSTIVDTELPTIVSVVLSDPSPTNAGVVTFTITFSEDMNSAIEPLITFGLLSPHDTHSVVKTSYSGDTWIGTFSINSLTGDGLNTLKIGLAEDLAGNQIAEHTMQFTIDTKIPSVASGGPTGSDVPITTAITITFNESMNKTTVLNSFSYTDGTTTWTATDGTVTWSANTMTFTPDEDLDYDTQYTVTMTTDARDPADNALSEVHTWSFTTQSQPDTTAPSISSVSHTEDDAKVTNTMTITFSEPMNHSKVEDSISIPGMEIESFSWIGNRLTITFTTDLEAGEEYTVTIGTEAEDEAGNALEEPYSWSFTPKEEKEEPSDSSLLMILLLIIVVVVVLVLLMLMKKRKPEQHVPHGHEEPYPEEQDIHGGEFPEEEGIHGPYEEPHGDLPPEDVPPEMPNENVTEMHEDIPQDVDSPKPE